MRVAILQTSPIPGEKELNLQNIDNLIGGGDGSDLYILPEMFNTSMIQEAVSIAEPMDGPTIEWMKQKAANLDAAIAGSIAISQDGKTYNRFCFVTPDGKVEYYDKRHLFTYAGEGAHHQPLVLLGFLVLQSSVPFACQVLQTTQQTCHWQPRAMQPPRPEESRQTQMLP